MKTDEALDLTAFLPTEDTIIEIVTPKGDPSGWKITLGGPSHPKAVAFADAAARRNLHRAKMIEQAQVNGRKYTADEKTPDEQRRENIQWIIARIVDWTPVKIGSEVYVFSDKAAEDLLIKPEMGWAYVQITEALNEDKRFTQGSAKP